MGNSDTLLANFCAICNFLPKRISMQEELVRAGALMPGNCGQMQNMASQRSVEALCKIGLEENKRKIFFGEYYKFIRKCQMTNTKRYG